MSTQAPRTVSVVIPVLDVAGTIAHQLEALERQTYRGDWEVVVADNGCTDGTVGIVAGFEDRIPGLRVVDATDRPGASHAIAVGVREARGEFVAFCDGDDEVAPGWLEGLVAAAVATGADMVSGRTDRRRLDPAGRGGPPNEDLVVVLDFLPNVAGGNRGVWRRVFDAVGIDESWTDGGADVDFAWRAQLAGHTVAFAPDAVLHARRRPTTRGTAGRWFVYGRAEARLFAVHRAHGVGRSSTAAAAREWASFVKRLPHLLDDRRRPLVERVALRAGRLAGSARHRVWFP